MRLAVLTLTRGTVSGGYAKYLREVVPRLAAHPEVSEVRAWVPPQLATAEPFRPWPSQSIGKTVLLLKREIANWKPDLVFIPNPVHVSFGDVPVVIMVHNMEALERPLQGNSLREGFRNLLRAAVARRACRNSRRVIAVSQHVRRFLVEQWRLKGADVGVVPHGVDVPPMRTRPASMPDVLPTVFTAGSIRPARGLDDIVGLPYTFAIAGKIDRGAERYAENLRREIARAGHTGDITWLGHLSPDEMAWCFENIPLFVMTSRAEACPNTVLEALAHGSLSVSTDQQPMPEFFEDAALYYHGGDPSDLDRAIRTALSLSEAQEAGLRDRSRHLATRYSWDATAERTLRELQLAITYNSAPQIEANT